MSDDADSRLVFSWSKAIATGNDGIDSEHMKLFDLIQKLHEATSPKTDFSSDSSISEIIKSLREYTQYHFSREEKFMESFPYDDIDFHKRAHAGFLTRVGEVDERSVHADDGGQSLVGFLYDWLNSHICNIDQVMVAKFIGVDKDADFQNGQTTIVINGAFNVASSIEKLSTQLKYETHPERRSQIRSILGKSSEHLINLVSLADYRVQQFGCPIGERTRLNGIRNAVQASACTLAENYARKIIQYGQSILSRQSSVTLGCGTVMTTWIATMNMLIELGVKNPNALTHETYQMFADAYRIANEVCDKERQDARLTAFGKEANTGPSKFEMPPIFSSRVASQGDVLASTALHPNTAET